MIGGGPNYDEPDEIPDKFQVTVLFQSSNEAYGTVTGAVKKVYTLRSNFGAGEPSSLGYFTPDTNGVQVTPLGDAIFDCWTNNGKTVDFSNLPLFGVYATGGSTIVYEAVCGVDKIGTVDPNTPDGIIDDYQITVHFAVENGTWDDGTTDTITKVFTLLYAGKPSDEKNARYDFVAGDIPSVGNAPYPGYQVTGETGWEAGNKMPTYLNVYSRNRTFTFSYDKAPQYDLYVEHRYYGGPLDTDPEIPTQFDEAHALPGTLIQGSSEVLHAAAGDKTAVPALAAGDIDSGYTYYSYALVTAPTTDVSDVYYNETTGECSFTMPEGWAKLVCYYAPRTDLKYTVEYYYDGVKGDAPAGADEGGTGTYGASITAIQHPDSTDVNGTLYNYEKAEGLPLTISATESENVIKVYYTKVYIPPYIPPVNPVDPPIDIDDENVPLADLPGLNTVDHYAYIAGYPGGTVRPSGNITRAEVATIFFRLFTDEYRETYWATSNPFSDVAFTAWYNNGVSTAANAGIVAGYPDGTFLPNNNITRAEFATIAARFLSEAYAGPDLFTDISGHWAAEYINRAANAGWISGYPDGSFHPDAYITRAEAVTLVNNMLGRMPHEDHLLANMKVWPDNPETAWYYEAVQEATNSHDYDWTVENEVRLYEIWTELLPERDWAALEKEWSNAYSSTGADVIDNMNTGR